MNYWWLLAGALTAVGCGDDKNLFDELARRDGGAGGKSDGGKGGGKDPLCGKHSVVSDHAIPDMLIVLDRSTSMSREGNDNRTDRWGGSQQAVSGLVTKYGMGVNFGLMTFPGNSANNGGGGLGNLFNPSSSCPPGQVDVDIGPDNGPAISQRVQGMRPNGYTPTAATLKLAIDVIGAPESADQNVTAAKYVLLVTDGAPNCSAEFNPRNGNGNDDPLARTQTIEQINELTKRGVKTYVVGYETAGSDFEGQLDLMAAAGGTGEKTHRSVKNADDLAATFDELAAYATQCSYRVSEEVDPNWIYVTVGGKRREPSETDGWVLEKDGRTVTLRGKACDDAKKGAAFTVEVQCEQVYGY